MKRLFDVVASASTLVLLAPILLTVALASRLLLGPGVLFAQTRIGLHDRPFRILKFRTMLNTRDAEGILLPDAVRLTGYGRFLRSTSLLGTPAQIGERLQAYAAAGIDEVTLGVFDSDLAGRITTLRTVLETAERVGVLA